MQAASSVKFALRTDQLLLLAVVGVAWGWAASLPFQLDDHTFLRALHLLSGGATEAEQAPSLDSSYLFRPVQLAWMRVLMWAQSPSNAVVFHLGSLALHAACVMLLHLLLRRWFTRGAALAGAALFAVMPAGGEAITWVAASSDLLSTALALQAALLLVPAAMPQAPASRTQVGVAGLLGAGLCAGLGLLAKESMLAVMPLLLLLALRGTPWRQWKTLLARAALFGAPVLVAWLLRAWIMGTFSFRYAGGRTLELNSASITALLEKLPDVFFALFAPWPPELEAAVPSALGLPKVAVALVLLLVPLVGLLLLRRQVWLALAALAALWPAPLFAAPMAAGEVFSRSLYMSQAAFAVLFAAAASALLPRRGAAGALGRPWRSVLVLFALLCALALSAEALLRYRQAQGIAAQRLANIHAAVDAALLRGAGREPVVALSVPNGAHTIPLIGSLLPLAYKPPFRTVPQPVLAFDSWPVLYDCEALVSASTATGVTLLEFGSDGAVLSERHLAAGSADGTCSNADAAGWFAFEHGFAPRGAPELELLFAAGLAADVSIEIQTDSGTLRRTIVLATDVAPRAARLLLDHEPKWMLASKALRVRVEGAPLLRAPRAVAVNAAAQVVEPEPSQEWPASTTVSLRLRNLPSAFAQLFIHYEAHTGEGQWARAMRIEVPAERLSRSDGDWLWFPTPADKVEGQMHPSLRPETLARMCAEHMKPRGLNSANMRVRVEAAAQDGTILSRSLWRQFLLLF